jgi:hypothetical protein
MDKSAHVPGKGSAFLEHSHGHHGFLGEIILINPESNPAKEANNKSRNNITRGPGKQDAAGSKTEEEGRGTPDKDDDTNIINALEFFTHGPAVDFESEKKVNAGHDDDDDGNVDVEDPFISMTIYLGSAGVLPSPSCLFGDCAPNDRAEDCTHSPCHSNDPSKRTSFIETNHIGNSNFNQGNHSTSANSLNLIVSFRNIQLGIIPLVTQ